MSQENSIVQYQINVQMLTEDGGSTNSQINFWRNDDSADADVLAFCQSIEANGLVSSVQVNKQTIDSVFSSANLTAEPPAFE
jgi:hypothetical protein